MKESEKLNRWYEGVCKKLDESKELIEMEAVKNIIVPVKVFEALISKRMSNEGKRRITLLVTKRVADVTKIGTIPKGKNEVVIA